MKSLSNNVAFASIVVITEKVYFSAHSPSVSGAWKAWCKAWCLLCVGWRCDDNLLQDLRQRVTKLWRRSRKHPYCKLLRYSLCALIPREYTLIICSFEFLFWRYGRQIILYTELFCWKCASLGKIGHYWFYEECYCK